MGRYVVEGEWTGYVSRQRQIAHRQVVNKAKAEALKSLHAIVFTDGTSLLVSVRETAPREKVVEKNGYGTLIAEALATGKSRVLVSELA